MHRYLQQQIKKEIKARIKQSVPSEELVTIAFRTKNSDEFKWIHSKEFSYHGTMFDIISIEVMKDGSKLLHCITDKQETVLFKNLRKYICNSMNTDPKNTKAGNMLWTLLGNLFPPAENIFLIITVEQDIILSPYLFSYLVPNLTIISPPPQSY
jgi:hypothetical protein